MYSDRALPILCSPHVEGCISDARNRLQASTGQSVKDDSWMPLWVPFLYMPNVDTKFEQPDVAVLWGDGQNVPEGSQVVPVKAYG